MSIKITDENGNIINGIPGPAYTYSFPIGGNSVKTTLEHNPGSISEAEYRAAMDGFKEKDPRMYKLMEDTIQNPGHYNKHPSGIECIQITRHMNFNLGNAIKYIWRADLKNDAIEDLKKAAWYIQDEIQRREKK